MINKIPPPPASSPQSHANARIRFIIFRCAMMQKSRAWIFQIVQQNLILCAHVLRCSYTALDRAHPFFYYHMSDVAAIKKINQFARKKKIEWEVFLF